MTKTLKFPHQLLDVVDLYTPELDQLGYSLAVKVRGSVGKNYTPFRTASVDPGRPYK